MDKYSAADINKHHAIVMKPFEERMKHYIILSMLFLIITLLFIYNLMVK